MTRTLPEIIARLREQKEEILRDQKSMQAHLYSYQKTLQRAEDRIAAFNEMQKRDASQAKCDALEEALEALSLFYALNLESARTPALDEAYTAAERVFKKAKVLL